MNARSTGRSERHLVNLAATMMAQALEAIVPTIVVLMVANGYGMEALGDYCVALAFASIAGVICGAGISNAVCFEVAAANDDVELQNAVLVAGVIVFACCFFAVVPMTVGIPALLGYGGKMIQLIVLLSAGSCLRSLGALFNAVLRGRREMQVAMWPMLLTLVLVILTAVPLLLARRPLTEMALACAVCQAFPPLVFFFSLRSRGLFRSWRRGAAQFRQMAHLSWMLAVESAVFRIGLQFAIVILPLLLTPREIGLYNAASKPFQILILANECITQFFLPYLAAVRFGERAILETRLQQFHKLAFFFTATLLVLAAVFAPTLSQLLFGAAGRPIAPLMAALGFGYLLYYSPPYAGVFKSIGKSRLAVVCATAQLAIVLVALPLLVPAFGVWGVIGGVCLAYAVYWLLEVWLYRENNLRGVEGAGRYITFLAFNIATGYILEASIGGVPAIMLFLCTAGLASLVLYWTKEERSLAFRLVFPVNTTVPYIHGRPCP